MGDFTGIQWTPSSAVFDPGPAYAKVYSAGVQSVNAVLRSMIDEIDEYWDDRAGQPSADAASAVVALCDRFHLVARQLRSRHDSRATLEVEDEYDVQDLLHALLKTSFDDVRAEEWTPSYAGKSARVDFLLKESKLVIETKKTSKSLGVKGIGDQLLVDIMRYKSHPDCGRLICFVYDPEGRIGNPKSIETDLTGTHDDLDVLVIVAPKGM